MSREIHEWLGGLYGRDPWAARRVADALGALMSEGAHLRDPLAVSTAGVWPEALSVGLGLSHREKVERLAAARRAAAAAAALVQDIKNQAGELESAKAELADLENRWTTGTGKPRETAQAAADLAAALRQAADLWGLLPSVIDARERLIAVSQRLQGRVDVFRARKEALKAACTAAAGILGVHQAIAAAGLADDGDQQDDTDEAQAALADVTAQMERELGLEGWPAGLMELRPGAPTHSDIRILFAVEPGNTALLIAVLEGAEVAESQFPEAVIAAADVLRRVRAGQAPEATTHGYDNSRPLLVPPKTRR
jgi:hypothetical protein